MKRIDTMSIRDILRHHHDLGLPRAEIAVAVSVSAGTVSNVLERAQAAGLSWPLPSDLDDDGLRACLYPPAARESGYAQPDWDAVLRELRAKRKRRRVRVTRRTLWEEYRDEVRGPGREGVQLQPVLRAPEGAPGQLRRLGADALRLRARAVRDGGLLRQDAGPSHRARRDRRGDLRRGPGAFEPDLRGGDGRPDGAPLDDGPPARA